MLLVYKFPSRKWATLLEKLSHLVATPFDRGSFLSQTHQSAVKTSDECRNHISWVLGSNLGFVSCTNQRFEGSEQLHNQMQHQQSSFGPFLHFCVGIDSKPRNSTLLYKRGNVPREDNRLCIRCFKQWDGKSLENLPCCVFSCGSHRSKCQYCSEQQSRCMPVSAEITQSCVEKI